MIKEEDILIQAMQTPNPLAVKFAVNFPFKMEGSATFLKREDCLKTPLFEPLFDIPHLSQIYVFENQMTLTFEEDFSLEVISEQVEGIIKNRFSVHNPDFQNSEGKPVAPDRSKLPEEIRQIEEILDRTIRPGLQADGGDIEVISFKDNKLEISYQGACGGCPSSFMGTLQAIENILHYELGNEEILVYPV